MRRLVTYADIAEGTSSPEVFSIALRHELETSDGRRVLLLNDRGWCSGARWTDRSEDYIRETIRMVVGPDEPPPGRTEDDMEILHWSDLQKNAKKQGVEVSAEELKSLPHDVVLSERLLSRIGTRPAMDL